MGWIHAPGRVVGTFDAVILDHDGTIVESHATTVRCYRRWADEYGVDPGTLTRYLGMPSAAIAKALVPPDRWEEAARRIEDLEVTDTAGVVVMPGAAAAFAALPADAVAIATSCTMRLLTARMRAAGLPLPGVVVTRDQVAHGKPAPDTFLLAAERLGVAPERALVVEDAPAGVTGARAGGFASLGILSNTDAATLKADVHVPDLSYVTWEVGDGIRVVVDQDDERAGCKMRSRD